MRTEQEWMRRMPQARSHKAQYRIDNFYKLQETASQKTDEKKLELDIKGQRLGKKYWNWNTSAKAMKTNA